MYGYGYKINSGLVVGAGGGGGGFTNTYSTSFDGVDDYVHLGDDNSDLQPTGAFSLSVWVKFDGLSGIQGIWEATSTGGGGNNGYVLWKSSANKFQFYMREGGVWKVASATTTVITGTWYHILCTWDGSSTSKIFVNGTEEGSQSVSSINYNVTTTINLGGYQSESISKPYQMQGNIDEPCIFDRVVTPAEIVTLSTAPTLDLSLLTTPPIAWYRNGDNGSYKSPQWLIPNNENKDKVSNYSFDFDGVDDFVDCGDVWNLSTYTWSPFTLSFWYKGANPIVGAVHTKSLFQFAINQFIGVYDGYAGAANLKLYLQFQSYNIYWAVGSNGTVDLFDDQWHNVVIVLPSGSNDGVDATNAQMYIDNTLIAKSGSGVVSPPAAVYKWQTLKIMEGAWNPLQGKMDEVAFWKTDETSDISSIYNSGTPTDLTSLNPIAWYKMAEDATFSGGVWTVPDSVGSNNGTSNGMTIEDRIGEAPNSENNALSYNMDEVDRVEDTP